MSNRSSLDAGDVRRDGGVIDLAIVATCRRGMKRPAQMSVPLAIRRNRRIVEAPGENIKLRSSGQRIEPQQGER